MPEDLELQEHATDEQSESQSDKQQESAESDDPLADNEELQQELYQLWLKLMGEDRYARLVEVRDVKQAEMYWRNLQYIWWSDQDQCWNLPSQANAVNWSDLDIDDMPRFEFSTNIYQGYGLTGIGAIAQAPPRQRFFPEDADDPEDVETAEGDTKLAKIIQRWNPVQVLMQDEVWHLYTGGVVGLYTRHVKDGERYGFEPTERLQAAEQQLSPDQIACPQCGWSAPADKAVPPLPCPTCGRELTDDDIVPGETATVPAEAGTEEIPNGRQLITAHGALNLKRPQWAKDQSNFHYLALEDEFHYAILRAAYPEKADKIKPGAGFGADDAYERNARLSSAEGTRLLTQTGPAQSILCTFARVWFRPSCFWILSKETRQKFFDLDPEIEKKGYRANFAGDVYCEGKAESMDKHWRVYHGMPGRGQHRPGIGSSMISVQDRFNTFTNISAETYEYGIPITYRAAETFDDEANEDQRAEPGAEVPVLLKAGEDIRAKIAQFRADSVSPDMYKHMMDLMGPIGQFLTGMPPILFGGAEESDETLGGKIIQRDQAMGRMGVFYVPMKQAHADIIGLACEDFRANTHGRVSMPILGPSGDFESESVDTTALQGNSKSYPEGDENFPFLQNQQRAVVMEVLDSPQGQALLTGPEGPDNAELLVKVIGVDGLKIPGATAKRKALKMIGTLTQVPPGQDMSPDMSADIPGLVDEWADDHGAEAQAVKRWLNDQDGQKLKKTNPQGWLNVKTYGQAQESLVPKAPPPTKPLSETFTANFKDLPPEAQAQALEQMGIHVSLQDFIAKAMLEKASKPTPKPPMAGGLGGSPQPGNGAGESHAG
jgi:hypothetical protein